MALLSLFDGFLSNWSRYRRFRGGDWMLIHNSFGINYWTPKRDLAPFERDVTADYWMRAAPPILAAPEMRDEGPGSVAVNAVHVDPSNCRR
jgi:hypothetical protein